MENNATRNSRLIVALFVVLAGILLIVFLPSSGMKAMDAVLKGAYMKIEATGNPTLTAAPKLVKFFFPFWSGLTMVAGTVLLLLALPIYRGERWGRPIALGMLAIPAIGGAYMLGPIMFFAKPALNVSVYFMLIGLIPYFLILLYQNISGKQRTIYFFIFTLLGVTAAYNFGNGHSSLRQLMSALTNNPQAVDHAYALGIVANWVGVILVLIGIPLLAARTRSGWWTSTIGISAMFIGTGQLYLSHTSTIEFLVGTLMAIVTLLLLVTPSIGGALLNSSQKQKQCIPPLEETSQSA